MAMMTSVPEPGGWYEYEAAHGTVQRHYKHLEGKETSTTRGHHLRLSGALASAASWTSCPIRAFADRLKRRRLPPSRPAR
ncbi:MAG: hypothetical protein ACLSDQ_08445 [Adlercreutzia equolifaciens]